MTMPSSSASSSPRCESLYPRYVVRALEARRRLGLGGGRRWFGWAGRASPLHSPRGRRFSAPAPAPPRLPVPRPPGPAFFFF